MGCFSCLPRQEKKGNMNCFLCFSTEGSTEGRRQNMNCFSCFSTEGKKGNMNWFSCFATQGSPDGKKRSRNCFSCFQNREGKTRKTNCFVCFKAQDATQGKARATKQEKKHKIRAKRLNIKLYPTKAKKDPTTGKPRKIKYFSRFPVQRKIRCKWVRKAKGKRGYIPFPPFKNKKRVLPEVTFQDIVFPLAKRNKNDARNHANNNLEARNFTYKELAIATKNFKEECLLGEGGFGRVYKGKLEKTGKIVAVKQLNREGKQGNGEFLVEVMMLSHLVHPHLVKLIGYCSDGDQRLLVYEFSRKPSTRYFLILTSQTGQKMPIFNAETRIKDPKKYSELVDPLLDGNYPHASLSQVLAIAAMCLNTDPSIRPSISDVVAALESLAHDPIPSK
ncbi:hypothetical protein M8C21_000780 [Ambrosia artemisiifolia]|uniref:Protein kinase domain-containing protein n=1 Tax=Ambrosia artemisiifolia TaxID=4212 RepID=A0AAD5CKI1_AMBAR|nr:hypothetical protein M8C21_000780 [Ambrosia artemisiifolia]